LLSPQLSAKRLELLQEIIPKLENVGVLLNASNPSHESQLAEIKEAARSRGIRLRSIAIRRTADIEGVLGGEGVAGIDALIAIDDPIITRERKRVADLANKRRIPTISGFPAFAESGFLVSYGPDLRDQFRAAANYVHRILQGARPADLPVEQPTKFELVLNARTARTLGISIPRTVQLRADQIIE
jgi:putative ABC transport system substrate-binding protein